MYFSNYKIEFFFASAYLIFYKATDYVKKKLSFSCECHQIRFVWEICFVDYSIDENSSALFNINIGFFVSKVQVLLYDSRMIWRSWQ